MSSFTSLSPTRGWVRAGPDDLGGGDFNFEILTCKKEAPVFFRGTEMSRCLVLKARGRPLPRAWCHHSTCMCVCVCVCVDPNHGGRQSTKLFHPHPPTPVVVYPATNKKKKKKEFKLSFRISQLVCGSRELVDLWSLVVGGSFGLGPWSVRSALCQPTPPFCMSANVTPAHSR